jgi:hypothetical protein
MLLERSLDHPPVASGSVSGVSGRPAIAGRRTAPQPRAADGGHKPGVILDVTWRLMSTDLTRCCS